jgi:release factor glutamine methyltransferase
MFVQTNTIQAVKAYFTDRLKTRFSENEIKHFFYESVVERLALSKTALLLNEPQLVSESDLLFFRSIVKRLLQNEPFQHIIGSTYFYDLKLKTDKRALVPRPETEELVDWVVTDQKDNQPSKIADICSGSGCIALALKSVMPATEITAIELSDAALALGNENAKNLGLNIHFVQKDVFDSFDEFASDYAVWVTNPPYIPESDRAEMHENVLEFDPEMALFVPNEDPLLFYREIGKKAFHHLKHQGVLYAEIHERFAAETRQLLKEIGFDSIEIKKDLQGKDRMIKAVKP